jgi:hypothetical protein
MISKSELNELFLQDDKFKEELREWQARLAAQKASLVRRDVAPAELKEHRNEAQGLSEGDGDGSWQEWVNGRIEFERLGLIGGVADALDQIVREEQAKVDRKLSELRKEIATKNLAEYDSAIAELRGKLDAVLAILSGRKRGNRAT